MSWSYDLLDPDEQVAFRQLAVCAGAFSPRTAAGVLGISEVAARDRVDALVAKSLVERVGDGSQSDGYRYLETLREYGRRELATLGEMDDARTRLEGALLPSPDLLDDWFALVNQYVSSSDLGVIIEDATRRDAANRALEAGRLDAAAFLFGSCVFYDEPGAAETTLRLVAPLASRHDELDPAAWRVAVTAKLTLERLTRRYVECLGTAMTMLDQLERDDPARGWFDMWRCALTTAVAPEVGLGEVEAALPRVRDDARDARDFVLSQFLVTKATALAVLRRLDEARTVAEEAIHRAPVGQESLDQALAGLAWILYLTRSPYDDTSRELVAAQRSDLGLAEFSAAPDALCGEAPLEERAAHLLTAARRRHPANVPTPFLLAFAWLAVEAGDTTHAAELAAVAELYDASTLIALLHLLAAIHDWSEEDWPRERDAANAEYLSPEHETAAKQGHAALNAEIDRWTLRLARRRTLERA